MHSAIAEISATGPVRVVQTVDEHIVEIVSDSGEGAQTCGQMFADICARNGNGVWTVEIIPAEIEPPSRSRAGASGNRIRIGSRPVNNAGDSADLVVALNEQVLYSRIDADAFRDGTLVLVNSSWASYADESIRARYAMPSTISAPMAIASSKPPWSRSAASTPTIRAKAMNMWVLGLLCSIYCVEQSPVHAMIAKRFAKKGDAIVRKNLDLFDDGYGWAAQNVEHCFRVPAQKDPRTDGADERQPGAGPGRHGGRHRGLLHVPHYAGHLGVAFPGLRVRTGRRNRPSGGGRNRGDRICHRLFLRRERRRSPLLRVPGFALEDRVSRVSR